MLSTPASFERAPNIVRIGIACANSRGEMSRKNSLCVLGLSYTEPTLSSASAQIGGSAQRRIAKAFVRLSEIDWRRSQGLESLLDKLAEQRIIWRELLDLEFQGRRRSR